MSAARYLMIELLSETTFSSAGKSGTVDIDVVHDPFGVPFVPGTTIRRLLAGSWREMAPHFPDLAVAGREVFGVGQEVGLTHTGRLDVGDGEIESGALDWIQWSQADETNPNRLLPSETLGLFTVERVQTAVDPETRAPVRGSLRRRRAVRRGTSFFAPISWLGGVDTAHERVLAMAALATRHGGQSRNRGAGHVRISVDGSVEETRSAAGVGQ